MKSLSQEQIASFVAAVPSAVRDEPMSKHTSLKIGGPARLFVVADSAEAVVASVNAANAAGIPWIVLGGGTNTLVSDDGYEGVVIQASDRSMSIDGTAVKAAAGAFTSFVARKAAEAGLAGFEWGATVPGTIGGATVGDAGCFGGEMRDVVETVEVLDGNTGKVSTLTNTECGFGYRESRLKHEPDAVLSVTLRLTPGDKTTVASKIDGFMSKRKSSQPQGDSSAGCMFKNFVYADESALDILKRHVDAIPADMLKRKSIGAGWLVDRLGLKGTSVGKAKVSEVHGNFVVNSGGARAQDIVALASLVKMKIRDELGIMLEDEVRLVGF